MISNPKSNAIQMRRQASNSYLYDKADILTQNVMNFKEFSAGLQSYGQSDKVCFEVMKLRARDDWRAYIKNVNFDDPRNNIQNTIIIQKQDDKEVTLKVLHTFKFTSEREKMSVIVQDEQSNINFIVGGRADSAILNNLAKKGNIDEEIKPTCDYLRQYGQKGMSTSDQPPLKMFSKIQQLKTSKVQIQNSGFQLEIKQKLLLV
ncbi:phospholipid-transporting atpase 4-like [Stylonychia lemnae]|uniref:Phospholipid-transporting atpase 4-like n=1 Tax=Stylonychia lemnae TaxID=5949 RepID=A0A078AJN3_STYLE|nr:phospholipid-transporting atpase 4-like [Stylonychia lemnae]|eukprot:CDW81018.1 phospholipid-transporting atpase 4-like [Stylonychia lemnae]